VYIKFAIEIMFAIKLNSGSEFVQTMHE